MAANVLATRSLLELAARAGVRDVRVSVERQERPAAERVRRHQTPRRGAGPGHAPATASWAIVRYVNIIGTRGSVIETFTQQVLADQPLSVTDERMTRYWISMDEAIWCALAGRASARRRARSSCQLVASLCRCSRPRGDWLAGIVPSTCRIRCCAPASGPANACTKCCCRRTSRSQTVAGARAAIGAHARARLRHSRASRDGRSPERAGRQRRPRVAGADLSGGRGRAAVNPDPLAAAGLSGSPSPPRSAWRSSPSATGGGWA